MNTIKLYILIVLLFTSAQAAAGGASESMIHHQVFVWLHEGTDSHIINKIIEETKKLKSIPGILDLNVGKVVTSDRDIVDDSYDIGIHMSFESITDMKIYLQHAEHQAFLRLHVRPYMEKILVYDFLESLN